MLFAGAADKREKRFTIIKSDIRLRFILDDLEHVSVELKCSSFEITYKLLHTLSLIEEKYYEANKDNIIKKLTEMNENKITKNEFKVLNKKTIS